MNEFYSFKCPLSNCLSKRIDNERIKKIVRKEFDFDSDSIIIDE